MPASCDAVDGGSSRGKGKVDQIALIDDLQRIVGRDAVLHEPGDVLAYEYDGSFDTHAPVVVVLPTTTAQVVAIVKLAGRCGLPVVPRGAGTGLASGSVAIQGGIVVVTARMNRILSIDYRNRRALVEPGVVNLDLTNQVRDDGYYFAPDPASQRICTIGGNVANNAGGLHCLKYGVTTNHILGLELVLPDGAVITTGALDSDATGYDLTGVVVGSEGTLGLVTRVLVGLTSLPEAARALLAPFPTVDAAAATASRIIASGIMPAALEMMDALTCSAVEAAYHTGYPPEAGAVLLIELDGPAAGIEAETRLVQALCAEHGAFGIRLARTASERAALWAGRKGALGAMGRLAPSYYLQDGTVPRTRLPETLRHVDAVSREYGLPIANVLHAGDGNLHPFILFDRRIKGNIQRVLEAGVEILRYCVEVGGTISGEHGIGLEKKEQMTLCYSTADLAAMAALKMAFNPKDLFNPGKIFPDAWSCGELSALLAPAILTEAR